MRRYNIRRILQKKEQDGYFEEKAFFRGSRGLSDHGPDTESQSAGFDGVQSAFVRTGI